MKTATKQDIQYISECFINVVKHIKSAGHDVYIDSLPAEIDEYMLSIISMYIESADSLVLIKEVGGKKVASLVGTIEEKTIPFASLGKVGTIVICWVSPDHRDAGIAKELVTYAEEWFKSRDIKVCELSFMVKNELAGMVWKSLGYLPFRVFSHKELSHETS